MSSLSQHPRGCGRRKGAPGDERARLPCSRR